jgi:polysaccharide export outer membrane protein
MLALRCLILGVLLLFLDGCSSGSAIGVAEPGAFEATAEPAPVGGASPTAGEYHLSPGDILDVTVFQVPDLNKEVQIDGIGNISLPLIGEMKVAGETVHALEGEITEKLKAKYLQSPQVSVFLKNAAGRQVTITGAVTRPGVYPVMGRLTLVQALAESGDINEVGDPSAILVFRQQSGSRMVARFNVDDIRAGKAADPDLYAGDMVVVDASGSRSAWHSFTQVLPVAGFFTSVAGGAGVL